MTSIATLERIDANRLADLLLAQAQREIENQNQNQNGAEGSSIAIVDVRDDGGHIKSSLHFPSRSLDVMMPTLLRKLADKDTVVFHCALSQQRGPSAALQYLREREAQQPQLGGSGNGNGTGDETLEVKKQTVYVLDRGFVGWQEVYGPDERLTENYRKELWEEGY
ncbi:putative phosphoprotein phosphatase-like protein [Eutypa lata UCREL1]|uniref:Putative phosphoprotein phosphatase-like protein n=1 Tax=Eutypa lata (strain UCR-EL1) TaxID=1287681 RepID=M7SKH0_EUTLA|nr:putative phosphoprotein phosphatase-like protein [Eutypa lata UCREL1]